MTGTDPRWKYSEPVLHEREQAPGISLGWTVASIAMLVLLYVVCICLLLGLPLVGTPTFRIDYHVTTLTRGDELADFIVALTHSRPVSQIYVAAQGLLAQVFLSGRTSLIIYCVQAAAVIAYFAASVRFVEWALGARLNGVLLACAWVLLLLLPATIEHVYKLETIVGTLSMVFGGLAFVFLARWHNQRRTRDIVAFVACFVCSLLAKEDFVLPPFVYLAWIWLRAPRQTWSDRGWRKAVVLAVLAVAAAWLFNKAVISGRAFISPVGGSDSPYYMSAAPGDLYAVLKRYLIGLSAAQTQLSVAFLVAFVLGLIFPATRWAALLLGGVAFSLMGPYAIMPNHVFASYSLKWVVFQLLAIVVVLQTCVGALGERRGGTWLTRTTLAALLPALAIGYNLREFQAQRSLLWHQSKYISGWFARSRALRETLARERDRINGYRKVAIIGLGPRTLPQTPWIAGGELGFFLRSDLGLKPDWVVYSPALAAPIADITHGDGVEIELRPAADIMKSDADAVLEFEPNGRGQLLPRSDVDMAALADQLQGRSQASVRTYVKGARVVLAPDTLPACESAKAVVRVEWDFPGVSPPIEVWVGAQGQPQKLWVRSGSKGQASTGAWVDAGVRFSFMHGAQRKSLAEAVIGGKPCDKGPAIRWH